MRPLVIDIMLLLLTNRKHFYSSSPYICNQAGCLIAGGLSIRGKSGHPIAA
ncbi:MAG: hypothetical protein WBI54_07650 [Flavobacteriaceae bacterium]